MYKKSRPVRKLLGVLLTLAVVLSTLSGIMPKTSATVFAAEHGEHDGVEFDAWESDNELPTAAGNYYLTKDVTISSTWNVSGETKLCLNGHSITLNADSGTVVNIGNGATLNLYDCGVSTYYYTLVDGLASGITNEDKSADDSYNSFIGGYITGGKESGVIIDGGIFNMYGGTIIGNMAEQYGGGVNVKSNGTFNMHSGRILGNKAGQSEGAYFDNYGRGGGVYVDGTFNMQGGLIAKNTASQPDSVGSLGGGVYCEYDTGTFVMSSGKIEQNWATFGGGVYDEWRVTVCGDAEITNNRSKTLAGGLYIEAYGQLTISGSVKITDNKKGAFDNNVVDNNVYIAEYADPIVIDDGLSDTSSIGVSMKTPGVFTTEGSFESKEAAQAVFSSDDSDYEVIADEDRNAKLKKAPVKYIRRSLTGSTVTETEESVEDYNVIHDTNSQEDNLTGWYVVKGNVTFGPRIEMSGEVNLILCDGATLTAPMGIEVKEENTLNIYGQSGDTGTLIATGRDYPYWITYPSAGIGVGFPSSGNAGIVNIHGGRVIATGATIYEDSEKKAGGAGIGGCGNRDSNDDRDGYNGGTVNIYGGIVTATGGAYAAGIGGGGNYEYAYATNGAGVNIYGGTVTTIGGENAVGIGGGSYRDGEEFSEHGSLELGAGMHLYGNATTEHPENDANNHKEKIYGNYERTRYMTINNVAPHSHSFTYSFDGATITATCTNTDGRHSGDTSSTLTIVAPTLTTYGGTDNAAATIAGSIDGVTNPDIVYKNGDTVLAAAPTDAGTYTANITFENVALTGGGTGNVTASVEYTIAPAALTNVSVAQNGTLTYTGEAQTPEVTTSATAVGGQDVTFTYSLTQDGTYGDMPTVTNVNDCGTIYYKASAPNHGDVTGSFTVSMNKADKEAPAAPTATSTSVNSITLDSIPNGRYKLGDGEWQTSPTFSGLEMNTSYTFYQKYAEDSNYNESLPSVGADISTSNHVHEWSYQADGTTITATCADTDGGHGTPNTATLTLIRPELTKYGGTESAEVTFTGGIDGVVPVVVYKKGNDVLDGAPTDAGSYTASVTIDGVTASIEYEIEKADAPVLSDGQKPTKNENIIYDGTEKELITESDDNITGYTMKYAVTTTDTIPDDSAFGTSIPKETNAGTYYVWYKAFADNSNNCKDTEPASLLVNIAPRKVTVSGIIALNKTYDGTDSAILDYSNVTFDGIVDDDTLTVSATGKFVDSDVSVDGSGEVVAKIVNITGLILDGADVDNYELAQDGQQTTTTATIKKKAVKVTALDQIVAVEGNIDDSPSMATLDGAIEGHKLAEITLTSGSTASATADGVITPGEAKIVSGDVDVTDNYEITYINGVMTVTKADSEVILDKTSVGEDTSVATVESPNLQEFADKLAEDGKLVKVELNVKPVAEDELEADAVSGIKTAADKLFANVGKETVKIEYLEIDMTKYVDGIKQGAISDTNTPIEIAVTYNTDKAKNPVVIRRHDGAVSVFDLLSSKPAGSYKDASYYLEGDKIHIYSQYFSDFAIVYSVEKTFNVNLDNGMDEVIRVIVPEGTKYTPPKDLTRDGYDFGGWYKDETFTEKWNPDTDTVTADMKLFAKWVKKADSTTPATPATTQTVTPAATNTTPAADTTKKSVDTGDHSHVAVAIMLMIDSVLAAVYLTLLKRKRLK